MPTAAIRRYERDRKRLQRAAKRIAATDDRLAAPVRPTGLVEYAASFTVTQGEHAVDLLTVLPWQAAFLRDVERSGGGELGLTVAAGAGKTTLLATVSAAGVAGPWRSRGPTCCWWPDRLRKRASVSTMRRRSCNPR